MHELDDNALLREFAERGSEPAFGELVARHVNKVHSVALRQVRNPHQAQEITQPSSSSSRKKPGNCTTTPCSPAGSTKPRGSPP